MIAVSRNHILVSLAVLSHLVFSSQLQAACSRDDVTFYLEKGFTTEQITSMCSQSQPGAQAGSPVGSQQAEPIRENSSASFLDRAIKAKDIKLDETSLQFTRKICVRYGEEDLYGFAPEACPRVKTTVFFDGLRVVDVGKKYGFYGDQEVRVTGSIKQEILDGMQDKSQEDRELVVEVLNKDEAVAVPVRDDFSMDEVKQVLQDLSI